MMKSAIAVFAVLATANADIIVSRTVTAILAGASGEADLSSGCTGHDMYGSNNCDLKWGTNYTGTINAVLPEAITTGATVDVDMKIDGFVPFTASCPLCGANCSFTVPIVKKDVNVAMPPCPLVAAGTYKNSTVIALPTTSPIPVKVSFKGTVTAKDAAGKVLIAAEIEGSAE
eukprot:TRINITY_DN8232_c0_g1_i1.p1 TRINITY_DN8232_c0_g1~~TRINITY_DN8232_c0_g1_i1.p1  ORF type:complete len:194 (+),score=72.97 TRINITY_DN8232_c0_g1_i1:66-584(+)